MSTDEQAQHNVFKKTIASKTASPIEKKPNRSFVSLVD